MYRVPPPSLHHTIQRWGYFLSQAPLKPFIFLNGSDDCNLINRFYLRTLDIYGFCLYHRPPSPVHKRPEAIPQLNPVCDQDIGNHWLSADGVSFSVTWRKKISRDVGCIPQSFSAGVRVSHPIRTKAHQQKFGYFQMSSFTLEEGK